MSDFGSTERLAAKLLSSAPRLKRVVKKTYQYANYLLHKKPYRFKSAYAVQTFSLQPDRESFFGYYDKSPLSPDGTRIIYQSSAHPSCLPPNPDQSVEVVCQHRQTGEVQARVSSAAYNWQQGTKLQWIGPDRFVFNAYDDEADRYVSRIVDLSEGGVVQTLPMPIYDCFGDTFALTLSFDRLARLAPDYGYFCRMDREFDRGYMANDGVFRMDMGTGQSRLIFSLEALAQLQPVPSMRRAQHSVNHIMIAPDGKRFMVIHRWYQSGRRYDRLVVAGTDGSDPIVLADEGMVSHCFWQDPDHIFAYLRHGGRDSYAMLTVQSRTVSAVGSGVIDGFGDGHPHLRGTKIVFDTYPNKARMKRLFLYDLASEALQEVGEFFEGFQYYGDTRCDLHPRLNADGTQVFFDSVHEGRRGLCMIDLREKGR